jgi:hypothetical protein
MGDALVQACHREWQLLAKVAEDDLKVGQAIEEAAGNQPEGVGAGLHRVRPAGPQQLLAAGVDPGVGR